MAAVQEEPPEPLAKALELVDEAFVLDLLATSRHLDARSNSVLWAQRTRTLYPSGDLEFAAERIFAAIDEALAALKGTRLTAPLSHEVHRARTRTISVLRAREPERRLALAKAVQLRVACEPLALCQDCRIVFRDALSTRGPQPFRDRCDGCRVKDASRRKEDARRRLAGWASGKEEVVVGYDGAGLPRLRWSAECYSCGQTFLARGINDARCATCRMGSL